MRTRPILLALAVLLAPAAALAQAPDSVAPADSAALQAAASGFPVPLTLGLAWGIRTDNCVSCAEPENLSSFSVHLGVTKPLLGGLGVGLDVSVWRRGHPAPEGATVPGEEVDPLAPPKLTNMLANASVTFSYRVRYLWVRAGVGPALAWTDVVETEGTGGGTIVTASGKGVGYTVGGGLSLPLAGPIHLAFYANWNAGSYDLSGPNAVLARGASHEYLELGMGIALR